MASKKKNIKKDERKGFRLKILGGIIILEADNLSVRDIILILVLAMVFVTLLIVLLANVGIPRSTFESLIKKGSDLVLK